MRPPPDASLETPLRSRVRGTRGLLLLSLTLLGCASEREVSGLAEWEAAHGDLRPSGGEPAPITSRSTLADYVRLALERSPRLRARSQQWKAALERIPQLRSLPDPRLTYGYFIEEVETRTGPQRHRLGFSQTIPWPGKLIHSSGVALEEAAARQARYEGSRLQLTAEVTRAYAEYHYLARDLEVTRQMLSLVRHWEAVAQARLRAGMSAAHRDVIKAQVELGRLEDRLATVRDLRKPLMARLNALLDQPAATELPWPRRLPDRGLNRSGAELLRLLPQTSPVLGELDRETAARRRGVDLAWQSYLPDLTFGFDFIEVGPARMRPLRGSGDDPLLARVGLNLPIWFGRYGASVSEARARLQAAEEERRRRQNALSADVSQALFAYRDAERKSRLYRGSLVPKAEQSLQAVSRAYEAGQGDFLDLLDAERLLLEFHLSLERARADRVIALAVLEKLVGTDLSSAKGGSR
jgi:outer membrane protein TolC